MKTCTNCGTESYRVESKFCLSCGTALPEQKILPTQNICTNSNCNWHKTRFIYPDNAHFCDVCGSPTVYGS